MPAAECLLRQLLPHLTENLAIILKYMQQFLVDGYNMQMINTMVVPIIGGYSMITLTRAGTSEKSKLIAPNFDSVLADRAKTAKQNTAELKITKAMSKEERRQALRAALGR